MEKSIAKSENKGRIFLFDNVKFFLIILVVVGHTIPDEVLKSSIIMSAFMFIRAFHMPMFLFVSGVFQSRKNDKLPTSKILNYVILGLLLKMMVQIVSAVVNEKRIGFSLLDKDGLYWYLMAMAWLTLICYIVRNVKPWVVYLVAIPLALMVGYDKTIGDYMVLSRTIVLFSFFYTGFILEPSKIVEFFSKIYIKIICGVLAISWVVISYVQREFVFEYRSVATFRSPYSALKMIENCGWQHRLIVMLVAAVLCFAFMGIFPNKKIPFVTAGGKNTLSVYFWHKPIIIILINYVGITSVFKSNIPSLWSVALIALGVVIALVLMLPVFQYPVQKISDGIVNRKPPGKIKDEK